jgi:hypothetical protein
MISGCGTVITGAPLAAISIQSKVVSRRCESG